MKSTICALFFALVLISIAMPVLSSAGPNGPSASGTFQFDVGDEKPRFLEFNAREQNKGTVVGEMSFTDPNTAVVDDPDTPINETLGVSMRAKFDCLKITGNRAVMSGVITESNLLNAIGLRVLLVVEDNGEGVNSPSTDKLTWGVYQSSANAWIPKDAERDDDNGASLSWLATDAERPDDVGLPSNPNRTIGCQSFPLEAYSLNDVRHGGGNVQVQP